MRERFSIGLRNRFSAHAEEQENHWVEFKKIYNETAQKIIDPRKKSNQEWISAESWKLVEERKTLKNNIHVDGTRSKRVKEKLSQDYSTKDKGVKKNMRKDKKQWFESLATKAETEASKGNMKVIISL